MGLFSIRLNDVGEGVAEAELIEWQVAAGDTVAADQILCVVMTDKAAVEIPSSVMGEIVSLGVDIGDIIAVGAELVRIEIDGPGNIEDAPSQPETARLQSKVTSSRTATPQGNKPLAAPSVRRRAREAGVELIHLTGTGPGGRITHDDVDRYGDHQTSNPGEQTKSADTSSSQIKVIGLRRKIAEKMTLSKSRIPHITIVEEVDVTHLQELRAELNDTHGKTRQKLTVLPFVMKAIVEAVREQPGVNAHYDDDAGVITQYGGVQIGIATQTGSGLMVPVVRHCEICNLWDNAKEVQRLAEVCRQGKASREELSGSTITITSLGSLGALATTPIINHPEVAIVGINKISIRPHWDGQQFVPRKIMNLSCSFDHRVVDGWDAAVFVNKLKSLLEQPAMLFVEG